MATPENNIRLVRSQKGCDDAAKFSGFVIAGGIGFATGVAELFCETLGRSAGVDCACACAAINREVIETSASLPSPRREVPILAL
jgi:hypothetical protein